MRKVARLIIFGTVAASGLAALAGFAGGRGQAAVSRAYRGHENDADVKAFVGAFPQAAGTRLDDCQTCHRAGVPGTDTEREFSPCGYCHLLAFPNPKYATGVPASFEDTLNPFGREYKAAGRSAHAIRSIAGRDSDGDGVSNGEEIAALRQPGDSASRPGQPPAPVVTLGWDEIRKLPARSQFMLMNTTKEATDEYALFEGVRVVDLIEAAEVDLEGAAGVTVFAPDGYGLDFPIDEVRRPFPPGYYYRGPNPGDDPEKSFVRRPGRLPEGVVDGRAIPGEPWLLLAWARDGRLLETSVYEKGTGRLEGEGPYRLVRPQRDLLGDPVRPGRPDRASKAKVFGDGWDFAAAIDHNAGACVRGACVIRVNPAPGGFEDYDWKNGWPLVAGKKIVVFGRGVGRPGSPPR